MWACRRGATAWYLDATSSRRSVAPWCSRGSRASSNQPSPRRQTKKLCWKQQATGSIAVVVGPLVHNYTLIEKAARLSLESYHYAQDFDDSSSGKGRWFRVARWRGIEQSAVLFEKTETECFVVFRGQQNQGFRWIGNINLKKSFAGNFQSPKRKCRVVSEYKTLYKQKKVYGDEFRSELEDQVSACLQANAGHGVGGDH